MQVIDSFCSSVVVFTKIGEVVVVNVLDGDLVVEGVQGGVLYDVLNALLVDQLTKFVSAGRIGKLFCRNGEEELFLEVLDG